MNTTTNPRNTQPRYELLQTRAYAGGGIGSTRTTHPGTASAARTARIKTLTTDGTVFWKEDKAITYIDTNTDYVRLEWVQQ